MDRRQGGGISVIGKAVGALLLAASAIGLCIGLFYLFYNTDFLPEKVRLWVLISDGGMILAILWMLRCQLISLETREEKDG